MTIEIPPFYPGAEPTRATLRFQKNYAFTFQIVQPVFTGGKIFFNYKNAELDLRMAKEREKNSRADTILNVRKMFYNIQIMQELLKAHTEAFSLAESNYNNVKKSFDLGMVSQYDLLRAELAFSAVKPDVLRVQNLLETSILGLKLMLGLPSNQDIRLQGELGYRQVQLELAKLLQSSPEKSFRAAAAADAETENQQPAEDHLGPVCAEFFPGRQLQLPIGYASNSAKATGMIISTSPWGSAFPYLPV